MANNQSEYDKLAEYGLVGEHGTAAEAFGELLRILQADRTMAIVALAAVKAHQKRMSDPTEREKYETAPPA